MSHFAEIDKNNIVLRVIVVADEHEADGANWCNKLLGGTWVQTSYNGKIRYNYAGIGFAYDPVLDAFIPPTPYPSWVLDATCQWQAPQPYPTDGGFYDWAEDSKNWVKVGK